MTELAIAAPVMVLLLLLPVLASRTTRARAEVSAVARDGARAASLAPDAAHAQIEAQAAVLASLEDAGRACPHPEVETDTSAWAPGGDVTVTVRCAVPLQDLILLAIPGETTYTGRATAPIDRYRAT